MKRIVLLGLSLLLLAQVALALPAGMAIRSERGLPFRLRLDGNYIGGRQGLTEIRFTRLAPGPHWADFQLPVNGGLVNFRAQVQLLPGRETRYVLVARRGYPPALQLVSDAPLPGRGRYPRPDAYDYQHQPTPFGGAGTWPGPGRAADDWYGAEPPVGSAPVPVPPPGGYPPQPGSYPVPVPQPAPAPYPVVPQRHLLTPDEVGQLVQAVKARPFNDEKVTLARQALADSDIRSEDLLYLLKNGFSFDDGRVELAKLAYARVIDRQSFYRVYEAFVFRSSVSEIQEFIDQYRGS